MDLYNLFNVILFNSIYYLFTILQGLIQPGESFSLTVRMSPKSVCVFDNMLISATIRGSKSITLKLAGQAVIPQVLLQGQCLQYRVNKSQKVIKYRKESERWRKKQRKIQRNKERVEGRLSIKRIEDVEGEKQRKGVEDNCLLSDRLLRSIAVRSYRLGK